MAVTTPASRASQLGMDGSLANLVLSPANATTGGNLLLRGAAVANCVPAVDGTSAGNQLNLLLAQLRLAGVIA